MNKDLLNILTNSNKDIDNQQLMDYLAGKLSEAERNELEIRMAENDFMNDAMEGLEEIKDKKDIHLFVDQMNRDLQKKLQGKKAKKKKRKIFEQRWVYAGIVLILALAIATWLLILKYQHLPHHNP
jgi:anti-sigma factor RsiW